MCVAWSDASAGTGRQPASPSAATGTIAGRGSWTGARRTASITSSTSPARRPPAAKVEEVDDVIRVERAVEDKDAVRGFAETTYAAKSWKRERRFSARIEATRFGLDIRYVVTNVATGTAEWPILACNFVISASRLA